jgi:hypothetical protein
VLETIHNILSFNCPLLISAANSILIPKNRSIHIRSLIFVGTVAPKKGKLDNLKLYIILTMTSNFYLVKNIIQ